jgi:redox-sensing transcriptional repressor
VAVVVSPDRPKRLPEPTVARLPIYQRVTREWIRRGRDRIDSPTLGRLAGVAPATVRRDLAGLGPLGTRGAGYDTAILDEQIAVALGSVDPLDVIVIGVGNLGKALVNSPHFLGSGARLVGLYDVSRQIIGTEVHGLVVADFDGPLAAAGLAVLCVPPESAQGVADRLVEHGIHAILNFAPQVLAVPIGTAVRYVDFSIELQILAYQLNNGTGPLGGGVLHALGITRPLNAGARATG